MKKTCRRVQSRNGTIATAKATRAFVRSYHPRAGLGLGERGACLPRYAFLGDEVAGLLQHRFFFWTGPAPGSHCRGRPERPTNFGPPIFAVYLYDVGCTCGECDIPTPGRKGASDR
eukprot:scaffold122518_cov66-Phaeocystis_antarctica.AAC.1